MKILNNKCIACNCCVRVTETPTGNPVPENLQYYQCIAGVESECIQSQMYK